MTGFQLTFFTEVAKRHGHQQMSEWLLEFAKQHGAISGTVVSGVEGFDRLGHLHSAKFLELGDQPIAVTVAIDSQGAERLFDALTVENIDVAFIKVQIEYGRTGTRQLEADE